MFKKLSASGEMKVWILRGLMAMAFASIVSFSGFADTIFVDLANHSGEEDGTPEHPFNTIMEGINAANQGDEVSVAPGSYNEKVLMKDGVNLIGSGSETTFISGDQFEGAVVTFNQTKLNPVLTGFTIHGGEGDMIDNVGGVPVFAGGGILILTSPAIIKRNVITGNIITDGYCLGGGIYVYSSYTTPQIIENVISNNVALSSTEPDSGEGGAVYVVSKTGGVVIEGNLIESNQAFAGGAIYINNSDSSSAEIKQNILQNNEAKDGGGVFSENFSRSSTDVVNNLILGNGSDETGGRGGGVFAFATGMVSDFSIVNNTLVDNSVSGGNGGAIWVDDSLSSISSIVANNVIAGNTAVQGGGIDHTDFFGEIRNNDFHNNAGGDLYDGGGSGATLIDNLFIDPVFVSPAQGNYRLWTTSPCIDAAYESAAPSNDLDGFYRPFDGDEDMTETSDIGAYEYPGGELFDLVFLGDGESLTWQSIPLQESYNLYRGSLERLKSTGEYTQDPLVEPMAEQFCNILPAELPFTDSFEPAQGTAVFYLVTVVIGDWEGPLGTDYSGLLRPNDNPCP